MTTKRAIRIALFTSVLCIVTVLIPPINIGGVPVTLQTFVVMLSALLLSPQDALLSTLLYLVLGVIGLPVFSGFQSGLAGLLGPTGGFLLAFPLASFFISFFARKKPFIIAAVFIFLFGIVLPYTGGALSLSLHYQISYCKAWMLLLIFAPFDIVKAVLSILVAKRLQTIHFFQ
jgi:biotin transport system substrate-specific component